MDVKNWKDPYRALLAGLACSLFVLAQAAALPADGAALHASVSPYQGGFDLKWPDASEIIVGSDGSLQSSHFNTPKPLLRHDRNGHVILVVAGAQLYALRYDRAGRLTRLIDPEGMNVSFGYGRSGSLQKAWLPGDVVVLTKAWP